MFFLFDCDNFFVSCERVFAPGLKKRPVVVLSNNDGCVVSRSYEAKALGIPMGAPYFKIERFFTARGGVALSSNYELYADMSARVMSVLRSCFPNLEVYSIDEAFARLPDSENLEQLAAAIRTRILRETGISVSAGIAPTKTLCKIAAHCAKQKTAGKTFTLKDPEQIRKHLQQLDVIDIWGVGRHLSPKLGYLGIFTAWELAQTPLRQIRRCFNLRLAQTVLELNGTPCLELETEETAQSLTTSRSFEYEIKDYELLRKILAEFADAVSIRLRQAKRRCRNPQRFSENQPLCRRRTIQQRRLCPSSGSYCPYRKAYQRCGTRVAADLPARRRLQIRRRYSQRNPAAQPSAKYILRQR